MKLNLRRTRPDAGFSPTLAGWQASTHAELAWRSARGAATRWAIAGVVLGLLVGLIVFAPAAWLARWIASGTGEKVLLSDARGTIWNGSAVLVLTAGPDSRDASALPGRLHWQLVPSGLGLQLRAQHACCIDGTLALQIKPGFGRVEITVLPPPGGVVGRWPAALLAGLGAPWNSLQLGGQLRLTTPQLKIESVEGRWRLNGHADIDLVGISSRAAQVPTLGTYRLSITGDGSGTSQITINTLEGAMQLSGNGTWGVGGVRVRAEASASAGNEAALSNLLNIIGRRQGARSLIAIG